MTYRIRNKDDPERQVNGTIILGFDLKDKIGRNVLRVEGMIYSLRTDGTTE